MKIYIMRGLPASGKTTKALDILKKDGNAVRVNRDELRKTMHNNKWTGKNEELTTLAERAIVKVMMGEGKNVIIDDTNLNPKTLQSWKDFATANGAKHEVVDLTNVDVIDCVNRDRDRIANGERGTGSAVIYKMALQYLDYLTNKKIILLDLDGSLADIDHRLHYTEQSPKDWKGFFSEINDDKIRLDVYEEVTKLTKKYSAQIILVSGRGEEHREATQNWLNNHMIREGIEYLMLLMRNKEDRRQDFEVKGEIYDKYLKKLDIVYCIDDRPQVILKCWEPRIGITKIIDVGNNKYFKSERIELNYTTSDKIQWNTK